MKKYFLFIAFAPALIIAIASIFTGCDGGEETAQSDCVFDFPPVKGEIRDTAEIVRRADKNGWIVVDSINYRAVCEITCKPLSFEWGDTVNTRTGFIKEFTNTEIVYYINDDKGFFRATSKNARRGKTFKYTYDDGDFDGLSTKNVSIGDTLKGQQFSVLVKHNGKWLEYQEL